LPASDEALLRRIARAEAQALGELYDRYGRLVFSLAVRIVGEDESAEEITQDVFVQVWRKASTYRPELGRPLTWLVSIARHRAIDALRRRKARPPVQLEELDPEAQPLKAADEQTPPLRAELEQARDQVQRALASLPEEQRSALLLAYFEGLSHSELAERLEEPLGTVKTRLRLGLQKLRQLLESEEIGRK
jgi:RNA polymerase sigma-70 factor (ECF subfamily)